MLINNVLQWAGTVCLLTMYVLMSFFPNLYPLNIVAAVFGGAFYLTWCLRVRNLPQLIVNVIAITISLAGLFKYYG